MVTARRLRLPALSQTCFDPLNLVPRVAVARTTAVLDADAHGRMYISSVELRAFEQDAGASNRQILRMETNAGHAVERIPAARRIT